MPPQRVPLPSRVNSLPIIRSDHELSLIPNNHPTRASCDPCRKRKLRCTGPEPREGGARMCERCFTRGEVCIFSARKPMGRPRTVSSTPPSPSPCFSQPTTPPAHHHPHHIRHMPPSIRKTTVQRHGFDMYHHGAEHMEPSSSGMGFPEHLNGWPPSTESGHWLPTPAIGTPSAPHGHLHMSTSPPSLTHTPMLMAPSASSDSIFVVGDRWGMGMENEGQHPDRHPHHHRAHQRVSSIATSDLMFEGGSNTHGSAQHPPSHFGISSEVSTIPRSLRCLCDSGRVIDDLRAQFRDVTSGGTAVVNIALGAAHSLSDRCDASATCERCMSDPSTSTALVATITLIYGIIQRAIPELQSSFAKDNCAIMDSFRPTEGKLTLSAMVSEVEALRRTSESVIANICKAQSPQEAFPLDTIPFDHIQQKLSEHGRRLASLNVDVGNAMPVSWAGQHGPAPWENAMPLTAI